MKLYINCDGVLLNTIKVLYRETDIFHEHEPAIPMKEWLKMIDWEKVLNEAGAIEGSVEAIKVIPTDKLAILATVQSTEEAFQKIKYIRGLGIENEIIIVPSDCDKNEVVPAEGNILVDYHKENLRKWQDAGGIAVQFYQEKKKGEFQIVNSLSEIHWLGQ